MSAENLREKAVEGVLWGYAYHGLGVYPARIVGGPKPYEKRTERMEGWNDAVDKMSKNFDLLCDWLESVPRESKELVEDLLLSGRLTVIARKDGCEMTVDCNDTFYWGCADCEEISIHELPDLAACYAESPSYGGELWVCRKRGMRPQAASYRECYPESEWPLFDACGPERDDPDGRGKREKAKP